MKVFGGGVNICLTGLNKEKVNKFSKEIAQMLNYTFIDAEEEFAPFLIKSAKYPTVLVDELLQENETQLLKQLKKSNNCVISVSADMFLSNNNAKMLKNNLSVAILEDDLDEISVNIQNLLKNKCKQTAKNKQELFNIVTEL